MPFKVNMPKLSPTMEEGSVVKWHVKEGDKVEAGQLLIEIATDKATVEYQALDPGFLRKILKKEGEVVKVGEPIAIFTETKEEPLKESSVKEEVIQPLPSKEVSSSEKPPQEERTSLQQPDFAPEAPLAGQFLPEEDFSSQGISPLAKKIAQEKGLDLSEIQGSGPNGRIMSRDLDLARLQSLLSFGKQDVPKQAPGSYEEKPLSPMRKVIAKRLQESKTFVPHFYLHQEIEVSSLFALKKELKQFHFSLTYNDFILKAAAISLREHKAINSGFYAKKQTILSFQTVDIAIAVAVSSGLITPIVRYADYKDIARLSQEVKFLTKKAKEGKLSESEYKGGSFTISNLGMYGTSQFEAIINPPQAAILAVGAMLEEPVVKKGKIEVGKVMKLTLSCDHRAIDGREGALFLKTMKTLLECPSVLLI